ncbi:MAG: ACT domain-containing protein, partial [Bryobacteraceae bacterium]
LAKTSKARNKIKHVINTTERAKAVEIGQKYLEREARRLNAQLGRITKAELERVAGEYGYGKIEDLHAALGYGKFSARQVLQKLVPDLVEPLLPPEPPKPSPTAATPAAGGADTGDLIIKVKGVDDLLVYRAKCCNPIRGEGIVGYVTRGKGIAVHSTNCPNVQNLMYEVERKIDVEWARAATETFPVKVMVYTDDRPGMLNQLTSVLFAEQSNIRSLEASSDNKRGGDGAVIDMTIEIRDKKQLERVTAAIRRISGVRDVERIQ